MHKHTHTDINAYIQTPMDTHLYLYKPIHIDTSTNSHMHTHLYLDKDIDIDTHAQTHT